MTSRIATHSPTYFAIVLFSALTIRHAAAQSTEAETLARERIGKNPQEDIALWQLARLTAGDAKKSDELIAKIEQNIKALPQSARCQAAAGSVNGAAAPPTGMIDGTKYVSKIKVSLEQPVALDPTFFGTRRDLNQFYPQPLGIAGGNVRKATANADSSTKVSPALGALLPAEVNIYQKEFEKAETILGNIKSGNDERLIENLPSASSRFGFSMIAAEKSDKAIGLFERLLQIDRKFRVHYRLGIAHQLKGDKPRAIAAFKPFLTYQTQGKAVDDVKQRLQELSAA